MRSSIRSLILPLAAAALVLAAILGAMHLILPGLARRREQQILGANYVIVETDRVRLALPRLPKAPQEALAQRLAADFEGFTTALYRTYGEPLDLHPVEDRITIRVFATHADLVKFAGRHMKQDLSHAGGFYDPASWSIALTLRPPRELLPVLYHEATHLIMDRSARAGSPAWSLWLAEGMAVYFEHSGVVGGRPRLGGADRRKAAAVWALARQRRHIPLAQLVRGGPALFRGKLASLAYTEAGLLVAYLLEGAAGTLRQPFFRYVDLERRPGPCPPQALEASLGVSLDTLETDWLNFLKGAAR